MKFYFGNKENLFYPDKYLEAKEAFEKLRVQLNAKSLTFLKQVHGISGHVINNASGLSLQEQEGDFLITNRPGCAMGVLTADCLPIILYDAINQACGIIHAGWRGSVSGISKRAVEAMRVYFDTRPENLIVYFGPSAKNCCYAVDNDFYKIIPKEYEQNVVCAAGTKFFLDNVELNRLQMLDVGVLSENMNFSNNTCTICNLSYHSFRRSGVQAGRQASIVVV